MSSSRQQITANKLELKLDAGVPEGMRSGCYIFGNPLVSRLRYISQKFAYCLSEPANLLVTICVAMRFCSWLWFEAQLYFASCFRCFACFPES